MRAWILLLAASLCTCAPATDQTKGADVDDDSDLLDLTRKFIEEADSNISVVSVSSGEEALKTLEKESFDGIISDFIMPNMDGIKLAKEILKVHSLPIILYTGHETEDVVKKAFSVGIVDCIKKEIDVCHYEVLATRVRGAVEKHRARARA